MLLVLPVLAFLLLKTFGQNAWKLRTYLPERVTARQVGAQLVSDTTYHRVHDDLALLTPAGQPFNPARALAGRTLVLAVGAGVACDAPACRALLGGLARVQDRYRTHPDLKLLCVVPADPTVKLTELAERVGAISGKWLFAAADPAVVATLRAELRDSVDAAAGRIWLLDRERHVRGIYKGTDPRDIDRLLTEIDVLWAVEKQAGADVSE